MYLLSYHSEVNADFINKVNVEVDHEAIQWVNMLHMKSDGTS